MQNVEGHENIDLVNAFVKGAASVWRTLFPLVLTFITGLGIAYAGFFLVQEWEKRGREIHFQMVARNYESALALAIQQHISEIRSIAAFFHSSERVERDEFRIFVTTSALDSPGLQTLMWVPRVRHAEREGYESRTRRTFPDFQFRELNRRGKPVRARRREEYQPIVYLEPLEGNETTLGFDLAASPRIRSALQRVKDRGRMSATGRFDLLKDIEVGAGFWIILPVYQRNAPLKTVDERRRHFVGFILGIVNLEALAKESLSLLDSRPINLAIFDQSDPAIRLLSYGLNHPAPSDSPREEPAIERIGGLRVLDKQLVVRSTPAAGFFEENETWQKWSAFFGVLVLATVITSYLGMVRSKRAKVEQMVRQRTLDLTESRQALEQEIVERKRLQTERERFFSLHLDLLCILGFDGYFKQLNPAWEEVLGYTDDELLARPFVEFVEAEDRRATLIEIDKLTAGKAFIAFENRYRCKDGSNRWLLWSATADIDNQQIYAIARDVTETKEAAKALSESESRLRTIVENVVDGIITADQDGIIQSVNKAAERIFGYESDAMIGHKLNMLMPEPYRSDHDRCIRSYLETGKSKIIGKGLEVTGLRKNGETFPLDLAISDIRLDEQQHLFTGIVRDITERKQVERMKNEFISIVSHELRTPLTSIRGALGLLNSGVAGSFPEKAKDLLNIAATNSERLIRLINDMLDIEKIESGKVQFDIRPQELMALIRQSIESNQAYVHQFGAEIILTAGLPDAYVLVDSDRFHQVMANLLSNAAKFSPQGGSIEVSAQSFGDTVRIAVTDHGVGIPAGFRERLFEKFSQADASDSRQGEGTGLGLSICKSIVEKMNGHIGFETETGKGSRFYFDLPLWRKPDQKAVSPSNAVPTGARLRILVCEDDEDVAHLLKLMLEKNGYTADIAYNAREAKELLAKRTYDAMTLDLLLPDQNGVTLLQELRSKESYHSLPVVVVSAVVENGKRKITGDAASIIDWLAKPIDETRLFNAIEEGIRKSGQSTTTQVLHVEDDPDILHIVHALLHDKVALCSAGTLAEAERQIESRRFDLVILDADLPDGSGLSLLPKLSRKQPPVPVVIFSASEIDQTLAEGVTTCLVKTQTSNEGLMQTITSLIQSRVKSPLAEKSDDKTTT
jgi:PAS domain S-box-containing protein